MPDEVIAVLLAHDLPRSSAYLAPLAGRAQAASAAVLGEDAEAKLRLRPKASGEGTLRALGVLRSSPSPQTLSPQAGRGRLNAPRVSGGAIARPLFCFNLS